MITPIILILISLNIASSGVVELNQVSPSNCLALIKLFLLESIVGQNSI